MLSDLSRSAWKASPAATAVHLSGGKWRRANHLTLLSLALVRFVIAVLRRESPRLLVTMPPRHGKSELISFWFVLWVMDRLPQWRVMLASYQAGFAASWGRKVRNALLEFASVLRVRLAGDSKAAHEWHTEQGGAMITAGVGGPLTGKGANVLVVDDPFKNAEQAYSPTIREKVWAWFQSAAYTRLEPGGGIIVVLTRWHEDDLAGRLLKQAREGGEAWLHIDFPAICEVEEDALGRKRGDALWPERFDRDRLLHLQRNLDQWIWSALYQQRPSPGDGAIWLASWWKHYDLPPLPVDVTDSVVSWDMTFKKTVSGSFVVGQAWKMAHGRAHLIDQVRGRWEFAEAALQVELFAAKHPDIAMKLVESAANGPAITSHLEGKVPGMVLVPTGGDSKEGRARAVSPYIMAGNVWLPQLHAVPWMPDFLDEATSFPLSATNDQVDAASQALHYLFQQAMAYMPEAAGAWESASRYGAAFPG